METWEVIRELKPYKGYCIDKCQWTDFEGEKTGSPFYLVSEEGDDDYAGEEYKTLKEAKAFIDSVTK